MTRVLIPARAGSKGIPNKNLSLVRGRPLIFYTINESLKIFQPEKIFVSSDSDNILEYSQDLGINIIKRPSEIAGDTSTSSEVIEHFIHHENLTEQEDCKIIYLQPTSPLRRADHIRESIKIFENNNKAESLVSVVKSSEYPHKAFILNGDFLKYFIDDDNRSESRQLLPKLYYPNGAIYIFRVGPFLECNKIPSRNIIPYFMDKLDSIDIDDIIDLQRAEMVLNARK
tara:strand:- start:148 stop:831 length:684 start_codon:yes stop_codon:yes gene_type:complete